MAERHTGRKMVTRRWSEDDDDGNKEEDCKFDGPTMDVILMVQNHDNDSDVIIDSNADAATNEDGSKQFSKQGRSRNLLLQTQKSLYGGLNNPKGKDDDDDNGGNERHDGGMGKNTNRMSRLMDRTISENEVTMTHMARNLHDTNIQLSKMSYGHRNSLLGEQVSLCGGLYAPTQKEEDSNHDSGSDQDKENQTIMGEPPWNTTSDRVWDYRRT